MTTYKTGQRFKAKYKGEPIEGTLKQFESVPSYFSLLNNEGCHLASYCYGMSAKELEFFDITDLEIIPDQDEPVKGDLVLCSEDGELWADSVEYYTGGQSKDGKYITYLEKRLTYTDWRYIRKAPTKEQTDRQEAERKAREFMKVYDSFSDSSCRSRLDILTEYILKTPTK